MAKRDSGPRHGRWVCGGLWPIVNMTTSFGVVGLTASCRELSEPLYVHIGMGIQTICLLFPYGTMIVVNERRTRGGDAE